MKNFEKYKTVEELYNSFDNFCNSDCKNCKLKTWLNKGISCEFGWLYLEAEDGKPLPCPFCGSETQKWQHQFSEGGRYYNYVKCSKCTYMSGGDVDTNTEAVAAHNRVAKAVMDAKAKETKNEQPLQ